MIDIDDIEKLTKFPKYLQYLKLSFLKIGHYLMLICILLYWNNISIMFVIISFLIISSLFYYIDLKIFSLVPTLQRGNADQKVEQSLNLFYAQNTVIAKSLFIIF